MAWRASAATQQEALGLSESRVKALNRMLIEVGVITMKDSPNGKRYGRRDPRGRITEAYGFDLSPIATRYAEFVQLSTITLFDGLAVADFDGLPASASRWL